MGRILPIQFLNSLIHPTFDTDIPSRIDMCHPRPTLFAEVAGNDVARVRRPVPFLQRLGQLGEVIDGVEEG